jgi:hypothetical protein
MLCMKSAVEVNLAIVEAECAVGFACLNYEVIFTAKQLVAECAVFRYFANIVDFVDDGFYAGVLV